MICVLCKKEIRAGEQIAFWALKIAHKVCVEKKKAE